MEWQAQAFSQKQSPAVPGPVPHLMPVRWQSCPEKQMAQRLDWAILLTIKHAACLIMLDRSTSTHQHRSGLGLHQLAISVSSIHGRRSLSLGVRFHQRRRFCVGPAHLPGAG